MNILITGGTGSLGQCLTEKFIGNGHSVTVLSRDPHKQVAMRKKFPSVRFFLGSVTDFDAVSRAMEGADFLIHAAAVKHVSIGEDPDNFREVVDVNAYGSSVVASSWGKRGGAIVISSDKAVSPLNLYGATKMQAEYEFVMRGYSAVRYGNVISSAGSFIHNWISDPSSICVRKPFPTRFYMSMKKAVGLVADVMNIVGRGTNGVFVPTDLVSFRLFEMATMVSSAYVTVGRLGVGEKVNESLVAEGDGVVDVIDGVGIVVRGANEDVSVFNSSHRDNLVDAGLVLRRVERELKGVK